MTFTYGAGWAVCQESCGGTAVEVGFYGVVNETALLALWRQMLHLVGAASAVLVRLDSCVFCVDDLPDVGADARRVPVVAVVTRNEYREMFAAYGSRMARAGLTRAVFLDSQLELARRWVERRAAGALSLPGPLEKP